MSLMIDNVMNAIGEQKRFLVRSLLITALYTGHFALADTLKLEQCPRQEGKPVIYEAQCGQLLVAENPADAEGRNIKLNISSKFILSSFILFRKLSMTISN